MRSNMWRLRLTLAIICLTAATGLARAGYEEGVAAFESMNYAAALQEFRAAAERGHAGAQYYLGRMHMMAEGVAADYDKAAEYFSKAAAQGNSNAQYYLGVLYYRGAGVSRDLETAVKWYTAAAAQGDQVAQYSLGVMYAGGVGVPRNDVQALALFIQAASRGDESAKKFREIIARGMTPDDIAKAERRAREQLSTQR